MRLAVRHEWGVNTGESRRIQEELREKWEGEDRLREIRTVAARDTGPLSEKWIVEIQISELARAGGKSIMPDVRWAIPDSAIPTQRSATSDETSSVVLLLSG
jgi:hypothetical protein